MWTAAPERIRAIRVAQVPLLLQHPHAHAFIVAPAKLVTDEWIRRAAINNSGWTFRNLDAKTCKEAELFSQMHELFMVQTEDILGKQGLILGYPRQ
jgi:hypothetical protein